MLSSNQYQPSPSDASSPLLGHSIADNIVRSRRLIRRPPHPLRGAARFLRRASSRRMMLREPSVRVREAAAEQVEDRQSDWAYSRPIIVLDLLWNAGLLGLAVGVLSLSWKEEPSVPLRTWIGGYAFQCLVHMVCVVVECKRRRRGGQAAAGAEASSAWESSSGSGSDDAEDYGVEQSTDYTATSVAKNLGSANTVFSFIWWILGFYWVTAGGENLTEESPQLYWICITFLALDVVFVVICVVLASLVGIAVCFCLPCIIAILYVVTDQEGATKEEIDRLPKYKFRKIPDFDKVNGEIQESFGGVMTECDTTTPTENVLSPEDAECCICLCAYEDGIELRELPCCHHFHCTCIDKWLQINATCPLCKFNILKSVSQSSSEEV
ncbi:E3 ubiquitin-protein ligase [Pyrus ussuriensis x Pyrus communis]|uniref:RING-type E3 ubiquitin transferase n=1 Tax=Pyrus ussuriensis x Pyrus communis TaxID=2448454 RepID=A0A5N5FEA7_9ROSA|nr:E3 ubiquitin-protein ligase [Pyrus ussuriensis x Pyrus communis]